MELRFYIFSCWLVFSLLGCEPQEVITYYSFDKTKKKEQYQVTPLGGKKTGLCKEYGIDGFLEISTEYKNGLQHGTRTLFCEKSSSILEQSIFRKGKKNGLTLANYCNGNPKFKVLYEEDKIIKVFDLKTINGDSLFAGDHKNGSGMVIKYDLNGKVIEQISIQNGYKNGYTYLISNTGYVDSLFYLKGYNEKFQMHSYTY